MPLPFFSSSMTGLANTWLCFFCYPDADIIIGTSAGSVDGAHLSSGFDLESLFTTHPTPVEQTKERKVEFDPAQLMEASRQAVEGQVQIPKQFGRTSERMRWRFRRPQKRNGVPL